MCLVILGDSYTNFANGAESFARGRYVTEGLKMGLQDFADLDRVIGEASSNLHAEAV